MYGTSHGKQVVGVMWKSKITSQECSREQMKIGSIVQFASEFVAVVSKLMPGTKVIVIENKDSLRTDSA